MKKLLAVLLILTILFCGCDAGYFRNSAGASGFDEELALITARVPLKVHMDLRLDIIDLLETDSYGRRLFHYRVSGLRIGVLLIVQKSEAPYVYYYEDIFYIVREDAWEEGSFQEADINWLKEQNDWNQPLNEAKMQFLDCTQVDPGTRNFDFIIYAGQSSFRIDNDLRDYFERLYPERGECTIHIHGIDRYWEYGQIFETHVAFSNAKTNEYYLVLYDYDYLPGDGGPIRAVEPIASYDNIREEVIAFKEKYCGVVK